MKKLKEMNGLTLIELLAVMVVIGILAGVATIAVGTLIKNAEKETHISNGYRMVEAARLYRINENVPFKLWNVDRDYIKVTLKELQEKGYLEYGVKSPTNGNPYHPTLTFVIINRWHVGDKKYSYRIQLCSMRDNGTNGFKYFNDYLEKLTRENVQLKE